MDFRALNPPLTEFEELMEQLGKRRYLFRQLRNDQRGPDILVAEYHWPGFADVLVLRDEHRANAYRTPILSDVDTLDPDVVFCWFLGGPLWTIRTLLALPDPIHPEAPRKPVAPPPGFGLPKAGRMPVNVSVRERR